MTYVNCYNTRTGHVETVAEFGDAGDANVRLDTLTSNDTSADHAYYVTNVSAAPRDSRSLVSA